VLNKNKELAEHALKEIRQLYRIEKMAVELMQGADYGRIPGCLVVATEHEVLSRQNNGVNSIFS